MYAENPTLSYSAAIQTLNSFQIESKFVQVSCSRLIQQAAKPLPLTVYCELGYERMHGNEMADELARSKATYKLMELEFG